MDKIKKRIWMNILVNIPACFTEVPGSGWAYNPAQANQFIGLVCVARPAQRAQDHSSNVVLEGAIIFFKSIQFGFWQDSST